MKKIRSIILICILVMSITSSTFAAEIGLSKNVKPEYIKNATALGFSQDLIEAMTEDDLILLYNAVNNGEEINVTTAVLEINSLQEIQDFLDYGVEKMIEEGNDKETVLEAQSKINKLFDLSDKELRIKEGLSIPEIKVLREIQRGTHETESNKRFDVSASGDLSQTKCELAVTKKSNPTSDRPVQYTIMTTYTWHTVPFFTFTDVLAYAWGGALNLDDNKTSATVNYYNLSNDGKNFTTLHAVRALTESEIVETIQTGVKFKIRMSKYEGRVAKSGNARATIYQKKKEGKESKLHVKYAHAKVAIVGGISISSAPAITIGTGFDATNPPVKKTINY